MVQKIALTGAHGVGKTTLAHELCTSLRADCGLAAVLTAEVPRIVCDLASEPEFFRRGQNNALKQMMLLYGQLEYEIAAAAKEPDIVICDRSVLDHWAYSTYLFREVYEEAGVLDICEQLVEWHCRSYDRLYRIPIEFPPTDDGTREGDEAFQHAIEIVSRGVVYE
jgi:thymidylate kinase